MKKAALSTLIALSLLAACDVPPANSGDAGTNKVAPPDAGTPDAGAPDAGSEDAGAPDAGAPDAGAPDAGTVLETFLEDFLDETNVDDAGTTATIDTSGIGTAIAPAPYVMLSPGDGSDGAYAPTADESLPPGTYQFSSVTIEGWEVSVGGDLTLLVNGPVTLTQNTNVFIDGALTLVANGPVTLDCAFVRSVGDLVIHLPSGEPLHQGCSAGSVYDGTFATANSTTDTTSSIEVWTRGSITLDQKGNFFTGRNNTAGGSGSITLRAYGDVTLRGDSYIYSGNAVGPLGQVRVLTEGSIVVEDNSFIFTGQGGDASLVQLRAGGDVTLNAGYVYAEEGSPLDVVAGGAFSATNSIAQGLGSAALAGSTSLIAGSFHFETSTVGSLSPGGTIGGPLRVESAGDVTVQDASLESGGGPCLDANDVVIRAGGNVTVSQTSNVTAADAQTDGMCAPSAGGDVLIEAAGTITVDMDSVVEAGTGGTNGAVTETPAAPVAVDVDPELLTAAAVESVGLSTAAGVVTNASYAPVGDAVVAAFASPDGGGDLVAFEDLVGATLSDGWRYRLEVYARMFDGAAADRLEVEARVPAP